MKINLLFFLTSLIVGGSASFYKNDFITTEYAGQVRDEKFIYAVYRTGADNYKLEFKTVYKQKITFLFEYYINDALYSKQSIQTGTKHDTLVISSGFQLTKIYYKSPGGATIELTSNPEIPSHDGNNEPLQSYGHCCKSRLIEFII